MRTWVQIMKKWNRRKYRKAENLTYKRGKCNTYSLTG